MTRQQVNIRLSPYTVGQLKELASRFGMSESTVITLAIDRMVRDAQAENVSEFAPKQELQEKQEKMDKHRKKGE